MLASPGPEFAVDAQDKAAMAQDRAAVQNWRVQSAELSFPDDCAGALGIVHSPSPMRPMPMTATLGFASAACAVVCMQRRGLC